jgi:hypothetical protein
MTIADLIPSGSGIGIDILLLFAAITFLILALGIIVLIFDWIRKLLK